MSGGPQYRVDLDIPAGWVQLPEVSGSPLADWSEEAAGKLLGRRGARCARTALAADLAAWTAEAATWGTLMTTVCYADGEPPPLAWAMVYCFAPEEEAAADADPFAGALAELGYRLPPWAEPPEATRTRLASGDALRVRGAGLDDSDPRGRPLVVQSVTYLLAPPGFGGWVGVTGSWYTVGLSAEVEAATDAVCRSLTVQTLS